MADTAANNDQWSENHMIDKQIDGINYPPNWLRFDDTAEFPNALKTGKWDIPISDNTLNNEKRMDRKVIADEGQNLYANQYKLLMVDDQNEQNHSEAIDQDILSTSQVFMKSNKNKMHPMEHHYSCLPKLRKCPTLPRRDSLIAKEVDKGVYSLVDRGIILAGDDVTSLVQLGSRSAKLPNLRFTKARIHDASTKNYKISNPFIQGLYKSTGVKLVEDVIERQQSMLFPPIDAPPIEEPEKSLPLNPRCTPKEGRVAKNRNFWNSNNNKTKSQYILGRDTPTLQVLVDWVIPFKDGVVFKHASAYQEFYKRFKNTSLNLCIEWIIQNIENLLQNFGIQYADVFCEKIIYLAQQPIVWPLLKDDLIMCIANPDEMIEKMNDPALKFKNTSYSRDIAATLIQRAVRTYLKRIVHLSLLEKVWATSIFQKYWKIKSRGKALRDGMKNQLVNESTKGCLRLINNLKRDWIQIFEASQKRVIVQVCNWTRPENASNLPNFDFARCFALIDPKVEIIFICPFLDPFREKKLVNLFNLAHRENNPMKQGRVHFLVPETVSIFQQNTSMSAVTCMSHRIIREIKSLFEGKDTLLYIDSVGEWDIGLSASLQIPIFGCCPDLFELLSTKSKARKFLDAAGVTLSPALLSAVADSTALLANLIKGTYTYSKAHFFAYIPSFKLNLDYPMGQVPVAYIDVNSLSFKGDASLESFAKSFAVKQAQSSTKKSSPKKENLAAVETAQKELETILKFITPGFDDFNCFMQSWKDSKGFLHAIPCNDPRKLRIIEFGFTLDVKGMLELIVSTETIFDKTFGTCGFFVPQQQLSLKETESLLKKIAEHCQVLGMMGRFTLEVWKWENEHGEKEFAANNLKAYYSTTILRGQTVLLASGCIFSASTDKMIYDRSNLYVETKPLHKAKFFNMEKAMATFQRTYLVGIEPLENRVAFYQDRIIHNAVGCIGRITANSFFESHGITFDYWSRTGSILPGDEGLTKSSIPIITIQRDRYSCIEKFLGTLDTTYSLLFSRKNPQFNTYLSVTKRVLYEYLLEKSLKSDTSIAKLTDQIQMPQDGLPEMPSFKTDIEFLDSIEVQEPSKLISTYVPISLTRLLSPADDDSIPRYQISTETAKLLAEGIPSNIEAEFDPTFHKPIILPPYKRSIKRDASFKESSESISIYKRNSIDNGSNSSVNNIPESSKKQPLMPTLTEDNHDS